MCLPTSRPAPGEGTPTTRPQGSKHAYSPAHAAVPRANARSPYADRGCCGNHIPGSESGAPGGVNLEKIFGHSGWACTSKVAKANIKSYGFVPWRAPAARPANQQIRRVIKPTQP